MQTKGEGRLKMAVEQIRGCGYRVVGGYYLCGRGLWVACDRLPYPIGSCPVCGQGIHFARAFTEINPLRLFQEHYGCRDDFIPCKMCQPTNDLAYIMMVGSRYYTPESFIKEALEQGVSKRIPFMPKRLKLGETIVYLAHPKVEMPNDSPSGNEIPEKEGQFRLLEAERKGEKRLAIFAAFTPQRVEKLIWESEATPETLKDLEKRHITPVVIPDGDSDHKQKQDKEGPIDR
jgi:hypothetical protein